MSLIQLYNEKVQITFLLKTKTKALNKKINNKKNKILTIVVKMRTNKLNLKN